MANEIAVPLDGQNVEEVFVAGPSEGRLPDSVNSTGSIQTVKAKVRGEGDAKHRADQLMLRFMDARDARLASGIEDEWAEAEKLYNQEDDSRVEGDWRSDAFVPHATREVNNALPHAISAVLDADRLCRLNATDEAWRDYATLEEKVLEHQLTQTSGFPRALELWTKQCVMLGTGVAFVGFRKIKESTIRQERVDLASGINMLVNKNEESVVDAYNIVVPLDIADTWVDSQATPTNINRFYYYERKSVRSMKDDGLPYKNMEDLSDFPPTMTQFMQATSFSNGDTVAVGSRNMNGDLDAESLDPDQRLHHLIHEWDLNKKTWSVVADGDVELLAPRSWPVKNEFPFVHMWYDYATGNRFYGRGVVGPISKSCRNANRLRRQRDDNVELCLQKMLLVRMGAVMDEKNEFVWRPGGVIHVRGGSLENAVQALEMGDVTQSAYADERIIKQDIEDVNGVGSIAAGVPDSKSKTAAGTSILNNNAILRLRGPIRHVLEAMQKVCELMVCNNYKFLPKLQYENMLGASANLYSMYKQSIDKAGGGARPKAVLSVHPAGLYDNTELQNAQLINALSAMGQFGLIAMVNQKELAKMLLKRIGNFNDTDKLFNSDQKLYSMGDFMLIMQESQALASGQQLPINPNDRHDAHIEGHTKYAEVWPQSAAAIQPHIQEHMQYQQALQMAMAGVGALPGGKTGVGPRPTSATSEVGVQGGASGNAQSAGSPSEVQGGLG